jgi:hypothetical protein
MRLDALDTVQDEGGAQLPEVIRGPHNMAMRAPLHAPHRWCDLKEVTLQSGVHTLNPPPDHHLPPSPTDQDVYLLSTPLIMLR